MNNDILETIRGAVRPIITFVVVAALVAVMIYLVVKFADQEMTKTVLVAFLALTGPIIGFWFGSRK